jgi:hypothetical protein
MRMPLTKEKRGQDTLFSGILIDIRILFDKEKRSYTKYASGILINIRILFDNRETKLYKVCFRYSLRQTRNKNGNDKCAMALSGIPELRKTLSKLELFGYKHAWYKPKLSNTYLKL